MGSAAILAAVLGALSGTLATVLGFLLKRGRQRAEIDEGLDRRYQGFAEEMRRELRRRDEAHRLTLSELATEHGQCKKDVAELRREIARLIATGVRTFDAVITADATGKVTTCNPRAASLLRIPMERLIGMDVAELVDPDVRADHRAAFDGFVRSRREPRQTTLSGWAVRGDGTRVLVEVSLAGSYYDVKTGWQLHAELRELPRTFARRAP